MLQKPDNSHGFTVFFVNNKEDQMVDVNVPTMEEAFQVIKEVERGER
jgi:hypothetical protein